MKSLLIGLAALGCIFFYSCKKEKPPLELPPLTHEGKDVLGCKINGHIFVVSGAYHSTGLFTGATGTGLGLRQDSVFNIGADQGDTSIIIYFYFHYGQADYWLTNNEWQYAALTTPSFGGNTNDSTNIGHIHIDYYDPQSKILSGTFEFNARSEWKEDSTVVKVTEGRFDLKGDW